MTSEQILYLRDKAAKIHEDQQTQFSLQSYLLTEIAYQLAKLNERQEKKDKRRKTLTNLVEAHWRER